MQQQPRTCVFKCSKCGTPCEHPCPECNTMSSIYENDCYFCPSCNDKFQVCCCGDYMWIKEVTQLDGREAFVVFKHHETDERRLTTATDEFFDGDFATAADLKILWACMTCQCVKVVNSVRVVPTWVKGDNTVLQFQQKIESNKQQIKSNKQQIMLNNRQIDLNKRRIQMNKRRIQMNKRRIRRNEREPGETHRGINVAIRVVIDRIKEFIQTIKGFNRSIKAVNRTIKDVNRTIKSINRSIQTKIAQNVE